MKKTLLLAIVLLSTNAFAMSKAEICSFRAQFVEGFAQSRDSGKSEQQTLKEAREMFRKKFGPNAPDMKTYVQMAYKFKEFTPRQMRDVTEISCLKED